MAVIKNTFPFPNTLSAYGFRLQRYFCSRNYNPTDTINSSCTNSYYNPLFDGSPKLTNVVDVFNVSSYSKRHVSAASYIFSSFWYCSYLSLPDGRFQSASGIPNLKGICSDYYPSLYPEKDVSFTISSIFIFLAIVAVAIRLFIYPFWRKLRK